ncbi:MAG: hypothetical protein MUE46_10845 [Xanthomonadales bacterium]|jgi:hypothetical protein|nr:hypothetical protein [Xanthomonadales bacterium]
MISRSLLTLLGLGLALGVDANEFTLTPLNPDATLRVGNEMRLKLSGTWRDACLPGVVGWTGTGNRRVLKLSGNPNQFCAQVLTDFELVLPPLTVDDGQQLRVAVIDASEQWLSEHTLALQPAGNTTVRVGQFDVNGAWYVPERSGSGLLLNHERSVESERIFGVWFNFDMDGRSRWYLLDGASWSTPTRLEGIAYVTAATPYACTTQFPNPDCDFAAVRASRIEPAGRFVIDFADGKEGVMRFTQSDEGGQAVPTQPIPLSRL